MFVVFEVEKDKTRLADKALKDDLVSRQSISVRDARSLDIEKDVQYFLIEGSEEAIEKSRELFDEIGKEMPEEEAKGIQDKIVAQDQEAASGVGMIFGD